MQLPCNPHSVNYCYSNVYHTKLSQTSIYRIWQKMHDVLISRPEVDYDPDGCDNEGSIGLSKVRDLESRSPDAI